MMRMLRAVICSMLRSSVALLKAPPTRGISRVASSNSASRPRSTPSEKPPATSPSPRARFKAVRSIVAFRPMVSCTVASTVSVKVRGRPSSTSACTVSPTRRPSLSARRSVSTRPWPPWADRRTTRPCVSITWLSCASASSPRICTRWRRAPCTRSTATWRVASTRNTPGARASERAAESLVVSSIHTCTSARMATLNCRSTMWPMASRKKLPSTTMATAAATPATARTLRQGRRSSWRRIMRSAVGKRVRPERSSKVRR